MTNSARASVAMPVRDPRERLGDFREAALGYTPAMAVAEASRCLRCPSAPCRSGCPVGVDIPAFIAGVAGGRFDEAWRILSESGAFPAVCGRICPQESQCEAVCARGKNGDPVAIGRLERFVADWRRAHSLPGPGRGRGTGKRVAVVGSGPAGLAAAGRLARLGHDVTVFEALHAPGGVLAYGIPGFRLPREVLRAEIGELEALGVRFVTDAVVGRSPTVDDLFADGFGAVFIGTGAGLPRFMGIPGETLCGVFSANEYLTRINLMNAHRPGSATPLMPARRVAVVGGGNVAMDAARCARRLGADAAVVYRRGRDELPARKEEILRAGEEGVSFQLLAAPVRILGDREGFVRGMVCDRMRLGSPGADGRKRPVPLPGSAFEIACDAVVVAVGTVPNPLLSAVTPGLSADRRGGLVTRDGSAATGRPGVFAGGDAVTGSATAVLAMGAGRAAADEIDAFLLNRPR